MSLQRIRLRIDGTVQGVGFRPYVYRLARALELSGFVRNDARGVVVEVEGPPPIVERFIERLPAEAPPLATCEHVSREEIATVGPSAFAIVESDAGTLPPSALVSPDTATCADCLAELFDPANRRYRYPFINCTNCGPRFTIVRGTPYDRPLTTMAAFPMCARCQAEYDDPNNRRFHAQPNACWDCGPRARLVDALGHGVDRDEARDDEARDNGARDAVAAAARALRQGAIVAVKGVGGYHLACRADDGGAVRRLRRRKQRAEKPFALMAADLASARCFVELDAAEAALLSSRERPIVLARRRAAAAVAADVAPRQRDLGVMLPYSPLHHVLLADAGATLVMTSGNVSDEPIAFRDDDALARLAAIADLFLVHDRPIETRTDDSVVRVVTIGTERRTLVLRRSRGYVPAPIALAASAADASPSVLACGGQLKNTYCLARDGRAWVGPHVGDLDDYETLRAFSDGISHHERLFAVRPECIAHDLHPEYLSTKYARDRADRESTLVVEGVQHHHAHLAACLAEHGESAPAIGVIFDGTGYGTDGDVWGGEILLGDLAGFERVGHLWPVRMPGGEAAIREPWRMACAWLAELSPDELPPMPRTLVDRVAPARWRAVAQLCRSGLASPRTTSMGRLFDAISALCGVRDRVTYEGQAAIELEMVADASDQQRYAMPLLDHDGQLILDGRALIRALMADAAESVPVANLAARAHNGVAYATVECCVTLARRRGVRTVVLSGGVFQNALLLTRAAARLQHEGLRVLIPERLPPNDGGLAFGQAAIAIARAHRRAMSADRGATS